MSEWLAWTETLPNKWKAVPLRAAADYTVSNVDKIPADDELPVRLCNYTDVYNNEFITADMEFMRGTATPGEIHKFGLRVGDVPLTKDSEEWDDIGIPALVVQTADDLVCGYHLALLRPRVDRLDGRFLFRCLQAKTIRIQLELAANGITRFGIPKDEFGKLCLPLPPLPEQRAIVDFLDRETARLDALVAEKERWLELVAEKRRALITRGLRNETLPLIRLKWLLHGIDTGFTPDSFSYPAQEGQRGVLKSRCVNGGAFDPNENKLLADDVDAPESLKVNRGDILMSRASGSSELERTAKRMSKKNLYF